MQDISRDDFSLLSGENEKDLSTTTGINRINLLDSPSPIPTSTYVNTCPEAASPITSLISSNIDNINIKLEDSNSNPYNSISTWHNSHKQTDFKATKLLLQNSDDPLISRGANDNEDDNPNELKSIVAAAAATTSILTSCATATTTTTTTASTTTKLLNESTEIKTIKNVTAKRNRNTNTTGNKPRRKNTFKLRFHHQALPPEYLSHYEMTQNKQNKCNNNVSSVDFNNKTKSVSDHIQKTVQKCTNAHETVRNWLEKISQMQKDASSINHQRNECPEDENHVSNEESFVSRSPRKVVKYSDLPYMGEMTLENSKPRRGRKPKKADICHLIYKNYGTILPGTPVDKMDTDSKGESRPSLLEKCLSKETKDFKAVKCATSITDEPLNLCLRDQSGDSFPLSSEDESSEDLGNSTRTSPTITTQSDLITDAILAANLKMSLPNFQSALLNNKNSNDATTPSTGDSDQTSPTTYPNWLNTGNFLHPMSLYYQKLMDARNKPPTVTSTTTITSTQPTLSNTIQTKAQFSPKSNPKILPQLIKKEKPDRTEPCSTPSSTKSSNSTSNSSSTTHNQLQPVQQKRKRSAIFIPPMPAENTTNPATEVSICKFKFTGGPKPTLQEKKMLSVDSDGNYRYYSGTGDKSMRGYEFFPRETLQQSGVIPGVNCSGAFLNATGEKISGDFPPPSSGLTNEQLQIPDSPTSNLLFSNSQNSPQLLIPSGSHIRRHHNLSSSQASDRRKRKSRRSIQREKLEKTFKEKGFLIQTQQLESAEGATYCKFRQLRKFTRYLFRSWKDYLPGEIQEANAAAVAAAAAAVATQQTSPLCGLTSGSGVHLPALIEKTQKNDNFDR